MSKQEFYKSVLENFFEEIEWGLDDFARMIKAPLHIFGEVGYEVEDIKDGKQIKILDIDEADLYIAPEGVKIDEEDLRMVSVVLKLEIDKDGYITVIHTSTCIFTKANKELALFISSLIGKKIIM